MSPSLGWRAVEVVPLDALRAMEAERDDYGRLASAWQARHDGCEREVARLAAKLDALSGVGESRLSDDDKEKP